MARCWRRLLLGTALLGLLTAGCHQSRQRCLCCRERLAAGPVVVAQPPPVSGVESAEAARQPPPTEQEEKPAPPPEAVAVAAHPAPGRAPARAASPFHAPDYGWLIGELHYGHVRGVWRLRYAPPDEEDPFGGTITLIEPGPMTAYRSGQVVRVEGELVDSASREPSPPYRVRSIQPAPRP